jgi:ubiquinone/menaquinone biosynthesis C-methylase UbiE
MKKFELAHGEKYITADIESPLAKVKMDIHKMPFAANSFDVVLCNHVLEHVEDDIQAMREIARVLRPGGYAIMQVPFFSPVSETTFEDAAIKNPDEREKLFGQDDHVRKYGKDYPKRIERAGLKPITSPFALELPAAEVAKSGLTAQEVLYLGKK